jgi:hypothetical protein
VVHLYQHKSSAHSHLISSSCIHDTHRMRGIESEPVGVLHTQERYTVPSAVRTSASCIAYTSDIFAKGEKDRDAKQAAALESEDQKRAKGIEQAVYEYRGALRRNPPGGGGGGGAAGGGAGGGGAGGPRLKCIVEEDVMYDVHSHSSSTGNGGGGAESGQHVLHDVKLGAASDCCLACIAEPRCKSWSMLVGLRYCQLSQAEVGPPSADAEDTAAAAAGGGGGGGAGSGRQHSESAVSGRLVPA